MNLHPILLLLQLISPGHCVCHQSRNFPTNVDILEEREEPVHEEEIDKNPEEIDEMNRAMKKVLRFQSELHESCKEELESMEKMGLPTYFLNSPWDREEYDDERMVSG